MPKTVLIVDDDQMRFDVFQLLLAEHGYQTQAAFTCQSGIELLRTTAPDVVLLDALLPDGDGFQVLEHLREFTDVPVIFLSGWEADEYEREAIAKGATHYVRMYTGNGIPQVIEYVRNLA